MDNSNSPSENSPESSDSDPILNSDSDLENQDNMTKDPFEAIYALNIGDFVTESFFSDKLLDRISTRMADDPDKLKAQLEELIRVYSLDKTLNILGLNQDADFLVYDSLTASLAEMCQVDACHLFQVSKTDSGEKSLQLTGTSTQLDRHQRWDILIPSKAVDFLNEIVKGTEPILWEQITGNPLWHPIPQLGQNQTQSVIAIPLREGCKCLGILLFEKYEETHFLPELVDLTLSSARLFVTGLRLQQLVNECQQAIQETSPDMNRLLGFRAHLTESIADLGGQQQSFLESLSRAVDARHHFTRGHSKHVGELARTIAECLALNEKTVDLVYLAGLLGSIRKVKTPMEILNKKDRLSLSEWEKLWEHPNMGVALLVKINFLSEVLPYVQSQTEYWDGSGHPEGLKGRSIPLGARILAVANAYFSMTQERPYRGYPLPPEQALKNLLKESGHQWDPLVVHALISCHKA